MTESRNMVAIKSPALPIVLAEIVAAYAGYEWELRAWVKAAFPNILEEESLWSNPRAREYVHGKINYSYVSSNSADWAVDIIILQSAEFNAILPKAVILNTNPRVVPLIAMLDPDPDPWITRIICENPACEELVHQRKLYNENLYMNPAQWAADLIRKHNIPFCKYNGIQSRIGAVSTRVVTEVLGMANIKFMRECVEIITHPEVIARIQSLCEKFQDNFDWYTLSANPCAIGLLEQYKKKIFAGGLAMNPEIFVPADNSAITYAILEA